MNFQLIFEKIGCFFFTKNRIWYFFAFLCLPFLLALAYFTPHWLQLKETEKAFEAAALRARGAFEKRIEKDRFTTRYSNSEPYFIDQFLEAPPLLSQNIEGLKSMKNHPACKNRDDVARRISYLEGTANRLSFAEENIRSSKRVKETEERLLHPVEIDSNDLSRLLSLIENVPVGDFSPYPHSPQLLIQDFTLMKKEGTVYELQFNLLKREWTQPDEQKN
jgi:hypothetical protein